MLAVDGLAPLVRARRLRGAAQVDDRRAGRVDDGAVALRAGAAEPAAATRRPSTRSIGGTRKSDGLPLPCLPCVRGAALTRMRCERTRRCRVASGVESTAGACDASAADALDAEHFVVASDENNTLRVYRRDTPRRSAASISPRFSAQPPARSPTSRAPRASARTSTGSPRTAAMPAARRGRAVRGCSRRTRRRGIRRRSPPPARRTAHCSTTSRRPPHSRAIDST